MAYVMGGAKYRSSAHFKKFLSICSRAFLTLREHADLLESLFGLMVAAGMPELLKESDIYYMRDKLLLNEKPAKAEKKLNEEIENSLDSKYRRLDNFIHNVRSNTTHTDRVSAAAGWRGGKHSMSKSLTLASLCSRIVPSLFLSNQVRHG